MATLTMPEGDRAGDVQVLNAATADGAGSNVVFTDGYNGAQYVEIQKTGTGTTTAIFEGSRDNGSVWYIIGYYQVDNNATLTRTVTAAAIGAGAVNHYYQLLDLYPYVRVRLASTSGTISLNAWNYSVPE